LGVRPKRVGTDRSWRELVGRGSPTYGKPPDRDEHGDDRDNGEPEKSWVKKKAKKTHLGA
jgi:hypothetical protein